MKPLLRGVVLVLVLVSFVWGKDSALDGDTIIRDGARYELKQIDAPEPNQAFGAEARHHLQQLIDQGIPLDRVSYRMVADGYAWWNNRSTRSAINDFKLRSGKGAHLYKAEKTARKKRLGLWSQKAIPPWKWLAKPQKSNGYAAQNAKRKKEAEEARRREEAAQWAELWKNNPQQAKALLAQREADRRHKETIKAIKLEGRRTRNLQRQQEFNRRFLGF